MWRIRKQPIPPEWQCYAIKTVFFTSLEVSNQVVGINIDGFDLTEGDCFSSGLMVEGITKMSIVGKGYW
jgi:hypothetical protein